MPDAPAISPATASYKWPSKVLRYHITCPFQRMLVVKHEAQIDWDGQRHVTRIESAQALDAHIRDVMLPALQRWMDPGDEKSHYCRQIDLEKMLANPAPHIQEARDLRKREGDEAARRFLLDHINRQKKEQFEGWWDYVMKGNPAYQKHPAFQYLILRPVLESSDAKTTRSPLPVNAEALAHLWDRIKAGRVDPRRTKLVQLLARFMAFGNVADEEQPRFGTDCRWVVIKRTDHNAAERVAALSQGSGWCVASSGMAASYLQSSDFHLLVEDGRARAALRLKGNQAVEVQGKGNGDPGPWWPRILLYLAARGTRISHRNEQTAKEGRRINEELADAGRGGTQRLGEVLKEQPAKVHLLDGLVEQDDEAAQLVIREAWLSCVRADPMCGGLLPEWMEVDAEMKRAVEEAWGALLIADPLSFQGIPEAIADSPDVIKALRTGWTKLLANNPRHWHKCPSSLQEEFQKDVSMANSLKISWTKLIANDPDQWSLCPKFLQSDSEVVEARKRGWVRQLLNDPLHWDQCPEFLQLDSDVENARKRGWLKRLENKPRHWHQCPGSLQQEFQKDASIINSLKISWAKLLANDPHHWDQFPEFLQSDSAIEKARKRGWLNRLENNPRHWHQCPGSLQQEFQKDASMANSLKISWAKLLTNDLRNWHQCPEVLKQEFQRDAAAVQKLISAWITLFQKDPARYRECPDFLRNHRWIVHARKAGWIAWLENQYPATRDTWIGRLLKEGVLGWGDLKPHWRKGIQADLSRLEASTFEISPDPLPSYAAASLAALAAEPRATLPVVQTWRHHPRMELANCQKALAALRHFPQNYDTLPPEQKEHALIREAAALGWADWVQKTPEAASKVPAEFQDHPEVAEQVRQALARSLEMKLKEVEKNPSIGDEQLEHLAIPAANRKMRKTIRDIRLKYWKVQVKKDWRNWSTMPPSLQQEEEVLKVMRKGLGPEIRRDPGLWKDLPEGYRQDECLQRVHHYATRD